MCCGDKVRVLLLNIDGQALHLPFRCASRISLALLGHQHRVASGLGAIKCSE